MLISSPRSFARGATVAYVLSVSFSTSSRGAAKMRPKLYSELAPNSYWEVHAQLLYLAWPWRWGRWIRERNRGVPHTYRSDPLGPFLADVAEPVWHLSAASPASTATTPWWTPGRPLRSIRPIVPLALRQQRTRTNRRAPVTFLRVANEDYAVGVSWLKRVWLGHRLGHRHCRSCGSQHAQR
jgi:hypothetical protein